MLTSLVDDDYLIALPNDWIIASQGWLIINCYMVVSYFVCLYFG